MGNLINSVDNESGVYEEGKMGPLDINSLFLDGNYSWYDDIEHTYEVPTLYLVILSILYGSISFLAVVGNSLVIWIIASSRHMQNVTNIFIANLALADIVIGLFSIPFQFQAAVLQRWDLPNFMCALCPFVQALSVSVSIFTLTAVAIDRHRAILKPLSATPSKSTAKITIAGIWLLAGILSTPMAIAFEVTVILHHDAIGLYKYSATNEVNVQSSSAYPSLDSELPFSTNYTKPFCSTKNLSDTSMLIYRGLLVILQYVIPLTIITCAYARMVLKLWGNKAPGNAEDSRDATLMKNKMRVIKMFIIVVALFTLCWLPLQTYHILRYIYPDIDKYKYINYIWFFCDWLAMSNSCYNPFIYGIYNGKFRREFQQRCPFKSRKWSGSPPNDNTEADKTKSTRTSIRYEWKRTISGGYPAVSSFYKGVVTRGSTRSFIDEDQASVRSKKEAGHYIRSGQKTNCSISSNKSEELYVFSPGKRRHTKDPNAEELCL
ncbi:RYamide receptor isoform X2 [Andrena cerasifolii]|uniref:RYamide receptor isoform X2 n=1 Tax=Andrena cerasifolii TaxID=2819439 RepID=UPI0040378908